MAEENELSIAHPPFYNLSVTFTKLAQTSTGIFAIFPVDNVQVIVEYFWS